VTSPLLHDKAFAEPSAFSPENLLREARRQKGLPIGALADRPRRLVMLVNPLDLGSLRPRAFGSVQDRQREEDAFYGSDERRQDPREVIVGRIESMTSVVIEMDEATVVGLRDSSGDGGVARGGGAA
jgi:hypothetical protein